MTLLLAAAGMAQADTYKIVYLNSPDIRINDKPAKTGDTFNDKATISWTKERQAMKVYCIETKKQMLLVARDGDVKKKRDLHSLLTSTHHLSTHGPGTESTDYGKLVTSIADEYCLLDSVVVETGVALSAEKYLVASYEYGDTRIFKNMKSDGGRIIIDKSLFNVDDQVLDARDVLLDIDFVSPEGKMPMLIKQGVKILIVPETME